MRLRSIHAAVLENMRVSNLIVLMMYPPTSEFIEFVCIVLLWHRDHWWGNHGYEVRERYDSDFASS